MWFTQDVGLQNPVHFPPVHHPVKGSNRVVGTPSGPEAVRAVQKVLLVDGLQHLADGILDTRSSNADIPMGSIHQLPLPTDRLAAILAVTDHPKILVELASDPSSPVRSHAAAVASFLQIEAVIPALESMLNSPIPPRPEQETSTPADKSSALRDRTNAYAEAVAAWRVAIVGLAAFDRRELVPRLTAILFTPPDWFVAPRQPDPRRDCDEIRSARAAVYRMLVRSNGLAEGAALKKFEEHVLPPSPNRPINVGRADEACVALATSGYFANICPSGPAPGKVDQVAIRGERARARIDMSSMDLGAVYRVSLRRQDGIWRVDDYWLRTER
jgi:hypothetical protein